MYRTGEGLKDFLYWRAEITAAKTVPVLKAVGEDLAQSQKQSDFVGDIPKLTGPQIEALRSLYGVKLKKLVSEKL